MQTLDYSGGTYDKPSHDWMYWKNGIYHIKCNEIGGSFYTSVWVNGKVPYYVCPCCGLKCKK